MSEALIEIRLFYAKGMRASLELLLKDHDRRPGASLRELAEEHYDGAKAQVAMLEQQQPEAESAGHRRPA